MEKDPDNSEEKKEESSEDGREKVKEWFTENLRMVVSVVIVVLIAGGIYAYSKRAEAPGTQNNTASSSAEESTEGKISVIGGDNENKNGDQQAVSESGRQEVQPTETPSVEQPQTSQETETSFVETAAKGDGSTNLARRALANYLEKNPDSFLTAEHKIYIEDYLRRQVEDGHLKIGDTREFSKNAIADAIQRSKELSESQLKNLQKYSQRVPELN